MYEEFTGLTYEEAKRYCGTPTNKMKPWDISIINLMLDRAKEIGGSILDVGCGTGRVAREYSWEKYIGVDISPIIVRVAREINPEYKFKVMNAEKLKFKDNSFDVVMCGGVLPHMPSEKVAVKIVGEMARVCRKLLLITWSTIPGNHTNIVGVTGHCGRPPYQNQYSYDAITSVIPKDARLERNRFGACELWSIYK